MTLLKRQHRLVEELFKRFEKTRGASQKQRIFDEIADNLAVHATIEERHFYPAVRKRQTESRLEEAFDEHLEIKKLLLDAMESVEAPGFDGMVAALKGAVEHHVGEEEGELFPKVEKLIDAEALQAIGEQMELEAEQLMEAGAPRENVRIETEPPAAQP